MSYIRKPFNQNIRFTWPVLRVASYLFNLTLTFFSLFWLILFFNFFMFAVQGRCFVLDIDLVKSVLFACDYWIKQQNVLLPSLQRCPGFFDSYRIKHLQCLLTELSENCNAPLYRNKASCNKHRQLFPLRSSGHHNTWSWPKFWAQDDASQKMKTFVFFLFNVFTNSDFRF